MARIAILRISRTDLKVGLSKSRSARTVAASGMSEMVESHLQTPPAGISFIRNAEPKMGQIKIQGCVPREACRADIPLNPKP